MIIRPCICIPAYNHSGTIRKVVFDCLTRTEHPVLVIDDGSTTPVGDVLEDPPFTEAVACGRLSLIRFSENRGKGMVLQEGFRFSVGRNFTHLVTMDADGQHLVKEISKLIDAVLVDPWALIIGNRKLTDAMVPPSTRFGRGFSNFWVKYQTGVPIQDSQSGFRVYPLFHVQNMTFWTKRYDFEIEVLIRLLWKSVSVTEIPIEVFYPPREKRISHFRKFWDNARISFLNVLLVVLSLLRKHRSPSKAAIALGLGVFIGCTPFFGLHTPIALALAFILRLNAPLLWLGTQVSLPFLAPFLVVVSIAIGRTIKGGPFSPDWMQTDLGQAAASFQDWLTGSLILGFVLGTLVLAASWMICRRKKMDQQRPWTGKSRGGRMGHWILKALIRFFGIRAGYFALIFIVPYFFLFSPQGRRASLEYWRITRPALTGGKRAWRVLRHFYRFGTILLDRVYQNFFSTAIFHTESRGYENICQALSPGSGAILLGAHVGAWEMAAKYLPASSLEDRFIFVQYMPPDSRVIESEGQKKRHDVLYVNEQENSVMKIYRLLRDKKMICMMGDRPVDSHYELVVFFGRVASFSATPFKIAAACQVPIVISFGFKKNQGNYHFMALPPKYYEYESGRDKQSQILGWIQEYALELEKVLADFPDQWFNFFPFWSSPPLSPGQGPAKRGRNNLISGWNRQTTGLPAMGFDSTKTAGAGFRRKETRAGPRAESESEF